MKYFCKFRELFVSLLEAAFAAEHRLRWSPHDREYFASTFANKHLNAYISTLNSLPTEYLTKSLKQST